MAVLLGCGGCGSSAGPSSPQAFSPYADATLMPGQQLATAVGQARVGAITVGFLDAGAGCSATWGGPGIDQAAIERAVSSLPVATRVTLSFGGRDGKDLALACPDPTSLGAAYTAAVSRYSVHRLDFDIEGAALTDSALIARRWTALAGLTGLTISVTLPVEPSGLTAPGLAALRSAIAAHVPIATVNVLAMDFGDANAPHPSGRMGGYVTQAATNTATQLRLVYPIATARPKLGVTVMIGRNDIADEVFTLADARAVLAYAKSARLASLSMWSLGRDRPCPPGAPATAQPTCSGVTQQPYAFAQILRSYRG